MVVTKKCDVYSFGVVALEIIMGRHPGDLLTSLSSPSSQNFMLNEILDQRLPPLNQLVAQDIFIVVTIALACLRTHQSLGLQWNVCPKNFFLIRNQYPTHYMQFHYGSWRTKKLIWLESETQSWSTCIMLSIILFSDFMWMKLCTTITMIYESCNFCQVYYFI